MPKKSSAKSTSRAPVSQRLQLVGKVKKNVLGSLVSANIDGIDLRVPMGTTILEAAQQVGVEIPTLCYHKDLCLAGICRICVVEVEGQRTLQAACTYPIIHNLKIKTYSPRIRRARKNIINLLLRNHTGDCYTCENNKNCELQDLAREYNVLEFKFGHREAPRHEIDISSFPLSKDLNKCILCRRCVRTCIDLQEVGVYEAINRGAETEISTYLNKPYSDVVCINCGQCVNRCPTGALTEKDDIESVWQAIDSPKKQVIIQTAPAPRAAIGEEFGLLPGTSVTLKLNTALKRVGFNKVFDTNFTADLTIMEEGTELLIRLKKALLHNDSSVSLPLLTSCSPGWVKYIEHFYPQYLKHLSTCKSPQQMFGAIIKTYYAQKAKINPEDIVVVSLMPCTAKKFECQRPEMKDSGFRDVDYALTTRELAGMIKECGVNLPKLPDSKFDDPLGVGSGAGLIFGATGGVMEAALRTAYELVTGSEVPFKHLNIKPVRGMSGVKDAEIKINKTLPEWNFLKGATLKVMVAHGTANAKIVMEMLKKGELKDYHFIEIMACPGGCLGGGGQPIPTSEEIRKARAKAIYKEDLSLELRKSHQNPVVKAIYDEFLTDGPCGKKSHKLLHTSYTKRSKWIGKVSK